MPADDDTNRGSDNRGKPLTKTVNGKDIPLSEEDLKNLPPMRSSELEKYSEAENKNSCWKRWLCCCFFARESEATKEMSKKLLSERVDNWDFNPRASEASNASTVDTSYRK